MCYVCCWLNEFTDRTTIHSFFSILTVSETRSVILARAFHFSISHIFLSFLSFHSWIQSGINFRRVNNNLHLVAKSFSRLSSLCFVYFSKEKLFIFSVALCLLSAMFLEILTNFSNIFLSVLYIFFEDVQYSNCLCSLLIEFYETFTHPYSNIETRKIFDFNLRVSLNIKTLFFVEMTIERFFKDRNRDIVNN